MAALAQRLYDAAEAFYFAGILASTSFDAANVAVNLHTTADEAANAALTGTKRKNELGAPPIVNFGFSIELYIKLLRFLLDAHLMNGHNLHCLFLELEKIAPEVSAAVIKNHRYARGKREEFIESISDEKSVFEDWRYAYEKEFLCSSPDSLLTLADAFRQTMREIHPNYRSAFMKGRVSSQ